MKYIDIKSTVWQRLKYKDDIDINKVIEQLKVNQFDIPIDEDEGFIESEILFDTIEELTPKDNDGLATIEIYNNDELLYSNTTIN